MRQKILILKLLAGIAIGLLTGSVSAKWLVVWTMQIMVFGYASFVMIANKKFGQDGDNNPHGMEE